MPQNHRECHFLRSRLVFVGGIVNPASNRAIYFPDRWLVRHIFADIATKPSEKIDVNFDLCLCGCCCFCILSVIDDQRLALQRLSIIIAALSNICKLFFVGNAQKSYTAECSGYKMPTILHKYQFAHNM